MRTIRCEDPGTPDAIELIDELSAALAAITGDRGRSSFDIDDETEAAALGYRFICLETRAINERAASFYLARGYALTPNYGKYAGNAEAVCLGKQLNG